MDIPVTAHLFNLRFVNKIKNAGIDIAFKKLQLVVQAYNNIEKSVVLTQLPTI